MQTSKIPSDAVASVVVPFTEDERECLLQLITNRMKVHKSNMTDPAISEKDREYYFEQHQLCVRILTKLGV